MKNSFKALGLMALLCLYANANGQDRTILGQIEDQATNAPIPGVSILVKGTTTGTISDTGGKFSITTTNDDAILVFSFVGYVTQEMAVGNSTSIDVAMKEDTKTLSEVVVTALGITRAEESLGYSVQRVSSSGMDQARETNFVNSLAGKVAGVQITGSAGNIGGSSRITMRGINSISGGNQPLFIVDGTPLDNSNYNSTGTTQAQGGRDFGNTIQDINPDDIESISVLKGANAAALYGNRASNGVILITTKSGKSRKGVGVAWNSTYSLEKAYILPDYQNEYGGGYVQEFSTLDNGQFVAEMAADESWGPRLEGQPVRQWYSFYPELPEYYGKPTPWVAHPDNIKDFYETGSTRTNNFSVEGGNDMATFRLSYTNVDQKGIVPNSSLKRNTFSINGEARLSPKLTAAAKVNYVSSSVVGRPPTGGWNGDQALGLSFNTWFERQLDLGMMKNYRSPTGRILNWNLSSPDNLDPYYWNNDYFVLYECYSNDSRNRIYGNVSLTYDITPHLKVTGYARTDFYDYI
ncbi:MAG: SusC/RagA family TonB-linked outer membrane protein, partial [Marivirga sp.]|nr:SusC/RagA family TonB-linked outer membrane protein [Marivirga sp.]